MLVDDNPINLQILSRALRVHLPDLINHMELVDSGIKALNILRERAFDLILMDIDMPIMNGIETVRCIRNPCSSSVLPCNRIIPIIAVTTNDSLKQRQTYAGIGMNGCISKPFTPALLIRTLSKILCF
ncbi:CheY-like superfamily [Radiomyces spectabilis]|uniref:CheY-like superfamily n=1 Tax=Radiomyces spectabilis TaxID=64574 RepID=UPI0022201076|nr:CheY-like superfamily [Radiomyces spectabilis]KAI8391223.1 CheY-like superfamily [Radiomyces spectabilis]